MIGKIKQTKKMTQSSVMNVDNPSDQDLDRLIAKLCAEQTQQRRCVVIAGDHAWRDQLTQTFLAKSSAAIRHSLTRQVLLGCEVINPKRVDSILGAESDLLIMDAYSGFNPNHLAAVCGILRAGGLLLLRTTSLDQWPNQVPHMTPSDQLGEEEVSQGHGLNSDNHVDICAEQAGKRVKSRFLQRFSQILQAHPATILLEQKQRLPEFRASSPAPSLFLSGPYRTEDQQKAVVAIKKVVSGHRRRPLLITSDRGRGKSAALGIAAAELLTETDEFHDLSRIIVTAPRLSATQQLFDHAAKLLPTAKYSRGCLRLEEKSIQYIPVDQLIRDQPAAGLLMVDEAAAIPGPLLESLLGRYSRIVFATTIHGYEGSGRGFALRFQETLQRQSGQYSSLEMEAPIRWSQDDRLEDLIFRALLLKANPARLDAGNSLQVSDCQFELLDKDQLINNEQRLAQVFGLLVSAHYQTKPSDLLDILDNENINIFALSWQEKPVAVAILLQEGGLDEDMAEAIYQGLRRPPGHLVPASLCAHLGLRKAPLLAAARVLRIAVHRNCQRRGLGSFLLDQIRQHPASAGLDYLAASFGATADLLRFWQGADYVPVRMGLKRNQSSGEHSVIVLQGLNEQGRELQISAAQRMLRHLPRQLIDSLNDLPADLLLVLLRNSGLGLDDLTQADWQDLSAFAAGQREHALVAGPIYDRAYAGLSCPDQLNKLDAIQIQVLISRVLQNKDWAEVAQISGLTGQKQLKETLRSAIAALIE